MTGHMNCVGHIAVPVDGWVLAHVGHIVHADHEVEPAARFGGEGSEGELYPPLDRDTHCCSNDEVLIEVQC